MTERDIFIGALQKEDPVHRRAYLDGACAGQPELRQQVDDLLRVHEGAGSFLQNPAVAAATGPLPDTAEQASAREGPGTVIGPYKLLEQIGEGGFGVVFMAEQTQPVRRKVALKVLKPGMDTRQVVARFEAERQALAIMDHPNIARVFDGGATPAGRPYFVMELVKGVPITEFCDQNHLTPRQRLALFVQACAAVQHAHQKGIIHRDLKPTNVLVTVHDTSPVVKVIDFGVAKALGQELTDKTLFTGFAQMIGTPLYMSPEQAGQSGLDVDTRGDIYSLGVLLYELLTGTTPFTAERFRTAAYDEIRRIIREEEPPRPSTRLSESKGALPSISALRHTEPAKLTKLVRGELDWIVMKALEKDRARRYETAVAFAADVERYLADEPVLACPPSVSYRVRKFARRNRLALLTTGAVAGLLVAGTTVSTWQAVRAADAERDAAGQRDKAVTNEGVAEQRRKEAEAAGEELADTLYAARMNLIGAAWEADNVFHVRELLAAQAPPPGGRDRRGFEWHYWDRLAHAEVATTRLPIPIIGPPVDFPQFSQDGTRVSALAVGKTTVDLQVWDVTAGTQIYARPLSVSPTRRPHHALTPDGRRVAVLQPSSKDSRPASFELHVYDTATGAEVGTASMPGAERAPAAWMSASADGSRVLTLIAGTDRPGAPARSPEMTTRLDVWDVTAGRSLLTVRLGSVRPAPAVSPDGTRAAVITTLDGGPKVQAAHGVKVWDVATGKELYTFVTHGGEPFDKLTFTPDGKLLAATGVSLGGIGVWVWDAATGKEVRAFGGRRAGGTLVFDPAGTQMASYGRNSTTVSVFDVARGVEREVIKGHSAGVVGAAFSGDGRHLRTLSQDGLIRAWAVGPPPRSPGTGAGAAGLVFGVVAVSPDGLRVAEQFTLGPAAGQVEVRDVTGQVVRTLKPPGRVQMGGLALDRGGRRVAVRSQGPGGGIRVYDVTTGRELLSAVVPGLSGVAIAPAGDRVAVPVTTRTTPAERQLSDTIRLLAVDADANRPPIDLPLGIEADRPMPTFSPDGRFVLTCAQHLKLPGEDGPAQVSVRLWDAADGRQVAEFPVPGFAAPIQEGTFSPDGSLVVIPRLLENGLTGRSILDVWETATGRQRFELAGHAQAVAALGFSPDGRRLASSGMDAAGIGCVVKLWDMAGGREVASLTCTGLVTGLAFNPAGTRLIGVRAAYADGESAVVVWDGRPRPADPGPPR